MVKKTIKVVVKPASKGCGMGGCGTKKPSMGMGGKGGCGKKKK
jgi:hypothetical protein